MFYVLCFLFVLGVQPLSLIIGVMLITFLFSWVVYLSVGSFWFGYALVLVMLSGVMVVYAYIMSLVPNEVFELSWVLVGVVGMVALLGVADIVWETQFSVSEFSGLLWESILGVVVLFLLGVLFGMMLVVVGVSDFKSGAMRSY